MGSFALIVEGAVAVGMLGFVIFLIFGAATMNQEPYRPDERQSTVEEYK